MLVPLWQTVGVEYMHCQGGRADRKWSTFPSQTLLKGLPPSHNNIIPQLPCMQTPCSDTVCSIIQVLQFQLIYQIKLLHFQILSSYRRKGGGEIQHIIPIELCTRSPHVQSYVGTHVRTCVCVSMYVHTLRHAQCELVHNGQCPLRTVWTTQ